MYYSQPIRTKRIEDATTRGGPISQIAKGTQRQSMLDVGRQSANLSFYRGRCVFGNLLQQEGSRHARIALGGKDANASGHFVDESIDLLIADF